METKRGAIAQVVVCQGCCCGKTDKGKPPVPVTELKHRWKAARLLPKVQLTISGCLGPCDVANVVCVLTSDSVTWIGGLTRAEDYEALFDWAACVHAAGHPMPLPERFEKRILQRFIRAMDPAGASRS
jgi:cobaltochelatase CobN